MNNNSNFDSFEIKYKEEMKMDTPDLWSRIDEKISVSDNSRVEEINYFNEDTWVGIESDNTRAVNKKVLASLAACFCIVIVAAIGYQTLQQRTKSVKKSHSGDFKSDSDVIMDDLNTSQQFESGEVMTKSILTNTDVLKQLILFEDDCKCSIYVVNIYTDEQSKTIIESKLIKEDTSDSSKEIIYITATDDVLEQIKEGSYYDVVLEKSDEGDFYIIKSAVINKDEVLEAP